MTSAFRRFDGEGRMPLREHMRELRGRLFRAALALLAGTVIAWIFFPDIWNVLKQPFCDVPASHRIGDSCTLVVRGIFDAFFLQLKVSLICGAVLSCPVWLYQLWAFIAPGLHRNERRWTTIFVSAAVPLFAGGAALAYFTLQRGLAVFLHFVPSSVVPLIDVHHYMNYAITMVLVFGISFELPLAVMLLNAAGVVSHQQLMKLWRPIVFGIFVFAAVATPSQDPFTMCAMAIPMCVLFGVALLVSRVNDARRARRAAAAPYAGLTDDETSPLDLADTVDS